MRQSLSSYPAILLIGHGTHIAAGVAEFHLLANQLQQALPHRLCLVGFLELVEPDLPMALASLHQQGFRRITVLPALLMAARHIKNDIPALLSAFQTQHPELQITLGGELGIHPNLLQIARERIEEAETRFGAYSDRQTTLLITLGRGSSNPEANSNIEKINQMVGKAMGFGRIETAYAAVAKPSLTDALERAYHLGFTRIMVFPYLLFAGRLVDQMHATVASYQAAHPDLQVVVAPYLNNHPLLVEIFLERLKQAERGQGCI